MKLPAQAALTALICVLGCNGQVGGAPVAPAPIPRVPPPPPDPDPKPDPWLEIPADLAVLSATSSCTSRGDGEVVTAVSAEGHLWLATSTSGTTRLRILDGWDLAHVGGYELPFAQIQVARAHTATTATLIADGRLFRLIDGERVEVSLPIAIGAQVSICGGRDGRALILSDGALYERVDDQWWSWSGLERLGPGARLLDRDGECAGPGDGVWLSKGDLELWRLTPTELSNPALLEGGTSAAISGETLYALEGGHLYIGPEPWAERVFAAGPVRLLAAAGAYAWVVAGTSLLRFDGHEWVSLGDGSDIDVLRPHASGGLWTERGDRICHLAPTPMVRVRGVHQGEQRIDPALTIFAKATVADMTLGAEIDGLAIGPSRVTDGWFAFERALSVGWHRLSISSPDGRGRRELEVKVLPTVTRSFATDVLPIYQRHCSDARCHVAGSSAGAPDLSRYEAWIARPERLTARIVVNQDMPPLASRQPDWGSDQVAIINEWLNGGMRP